jgi:hypothetical protein
LYGWFQRLGNWYLVARILGAVVGLPVFWALIWAELFGSLLWDTLFAVQRRVGDSGLG